jgi:hypothetical protein
VDEARGILGELDERAARGEYVAAFSRLQIHRRLDDVASVRRELARAVEEVTPPFSLWVCFSMRSAEIPRSVACSMRGITARDPVPRHERPRHGIRHEGRSDVMAIPLTLANARTRQSATATRHPRRSVRRGGRDMDAPVATAAVGRVHAPRGVAPCARRHQ